MKYTEFLVNGKAPWWWHWRNFTPKEVSCQCCGEIWDSKYGTVPPIWFFEAMDALQRLRDKLGRPLVLTCGHRCRKHNKDVGGVDNSQHYTHIAFDCVCPFEDQQDFAQIAHDAGFKYVLTYPDRGFVHCDMRAGK